MARPPWRRALNAAPLPPRDFARPRIVLSRCLEMEACRYNGTVIPSAPVRALDPWVEWAPVCPEVEVGLGVPRDPIRLVRTEGRTLLVQPSTGRDLTEAMTGVGEGFLEAVGPVDGFLLKSRSPSCGIDPVKVWDAPEGTTVVGGEPGMFAAAVLARFPDRPVEHEAALTEPEAWDPFLTRVFALADLRRVETGGRMGELVGFQARHKLLLMAHDPSGQKALGRLVAEGASRPFRELAAEYAGRFRATMARTASPGRHVNVVQHALGYFHDRLEAEEKRRFVELQEAYVAGRSGRGPLRAKLRRWTLRFGEPWLARQSYLWPYPDALAEANEPRRGAPDV